MIILFIVLYLYHESYRIWSASWLFWNHTNLWLGYDQHRFMQLCDQTSTSMRSYFLHYDKLWSACFVCKGNTEVIFNLEYQTILQFLSQIWMDSAPQSGWQKFYMSRSELDFLWVLLSYLAQPVSDCLYSWNLHTEILMYKNFQVCCMRRILLELLELVTPHCINCVQMHSVTYADTLTNLEPNWQCWIQRSWLIEWWLTALSHVFISDFFSIRSAWFGTRVPQKQCFPASHSCIRRHFESRPREFKTDYLKTRRWWQSHFSKHVEQLRMWKLPMDLIFKRIYIFEWFVEK